MNILVTGGNGYIGSRLVERYLQERHKPTIIDRQAKNGSTKTNQRVRMFKMDAEDPRCEGVFADARYDLVIHLACQALPLHHGEAFNRILHANLAALGNILYLSQKFAIPKVIVLFDYRIYGQHDGAVKIEKSELAPDCDTGYQEKMREEYCEAYLRQGLQVVSLRTGMIYGATQTDHPDSVTMRQLFLPYDAERKLLRPYIQNQSIDCLFINDLIEAIIRVGENQTSPVLNISSGQTTSLAAFRAISRTAWQAIEHESPDAAKNGNGSSNGAAAAVTVQAGASENDDSPGYCLDYTRAAFELEWLPKYGLEEGIQKTVQYLARQEDQIYSISRTSQPAKKKIGWSALAGRLGFSRHEGLSGQSNQSNQPSQSDQSGGSGWLANPDVESLALFVMTALLVYWLNYRMGIGLDLLLLYVVLVNVFFGLRAGGTAIALAILVRLWFYFGVENVRLIDFFNDANKVMYLAFYFIIGIIAGYVNDKARQEKATLKSELEQSRNDQKYTAELYQSSLAVKNSLQSIIADTEDSFSKVQFICSELDQIDAEMILSKAAWIVSEIMKTPQVSIYHVCQTGDYLRFVTANVPVNYPRSIQVASNKLLQAVVWKQKIKINMDMQPGSPIACAPICIGRDTIAVIFLDGIDFLQLNQHFLNTLKSLAQLIAFFVKKASDLDHALANEKYYGRTSIIRQEWFKKILTAKQTAKNGDRQRPILFKLNMDISRVGNAHKRIAPLVRSVDYVGEMEDRKIGVLMSNIGYMDIPAIVDRFADNEIQAAWVELV